MKRPMCFRKVSIVNSRLNVCKPFIGIVSWNFHQKQLYSFFDDSFWRLWSTVWVYKLHKITSILFKTLSPFKPDQGFRGRSKVNPNNKGTSARGFFVGISLGNSSQFIFWNCLKLYLYSFDNNTIIAIATSLLQRELQWSK